MLEYVFVVRPCLHTLLAAAAQTTTKRATPCLCKHAHRASLQTQYCLLSHMVKHTKPSSEVPLDAHVSSTF